MKERKESQVVKVLRIVNRRKNQKTYEINRQGLDMFITNASRYLRKLAANKLVTSNYVNGKPYKQWNITKAGRDLLK